MYWALMDTGVVADSFIDVFLCASLVLIVCGKGKASPYSIAERGVPELIPFLAVSLQVA